MQRHATIPFDDIVTISAVFASKTTCKIETNAMTQKVSYVATVYSSSNKLLLVLYGAHQRKTCLGLVSELVRQGRHDEHEFQCQSNDIYVRIFVLD